MNQVDSTTALQSRKQPQPGDVLDGIYRLDKPLGKGGIGVVYKAWHQHLQRPCAIKFLHPQLVSNAELRTRFRREAQSAFQLGHPHIVAITDFRDDPTAWPYIVMELVNGETLRDRLERGPLAPVQAVTVMAQLCDALSMAHRRGVIHRDLKPENLLLAHQDSPEAGEEEIALKVLDFGLSKLLDGVEITGSGRLLGSPSYMSPEQARGDSHLVDPRSDIFAVGALLYECLVGEKLFSAENFEQKRQQIIAAKLPPLGLMERGLPPQLERIIAKACAKQPEDRYQSAASLMDALGNVYPRHGKATHVSNSQPALAPVQKPPAPSLPKPPVVDATSAGSSVGGGEIILGLSIEEPKRASKSKALVAAGLVTAFVGVVVGIGLWQSSSQPRAQAPQTDSAASDKALATDKGKGKGIAADPAVATSGPPPEAKRPAPTPVVASNAVVPPPVETAPVNPPTVAATGRPELRLGGGPAGTWRKPINSKWAKPGGAAPPIAATGSRPMPVVTTAEGGSATEKAVPTVNGVMRKAVAPVTRCYAETTALPGKISVDLTVGADGRVSDVAVEGADSERSCVLGVMRGLRFAPPTDGDSYSLQYDFVNLRR